MLRGGSQPLSNGILRELLPLAGHSVAVTFRFPWTLFQNIWCEPGSGQDLGWADLEPAGWVRCLQEGWQTTDIPVCLKHHPMHPALHTKPVRSLPSVTLPAPPKVIHFWVLPCGNVLPMAVHPCKCSCVAPSVEGLSQAFWDTQDIIWHGSKGLIKI